MRIWYYITYFYYYRWHGIAWHGQKSKIIIENWKRKKKYIVCHSLKLNLFNILSINVNGIHVCFGIAFVIGWKKWGLLYSLKCMSRHWVNLFGILNMTILPISTKSTTYEYSNYFYDYYLGLLTFFFFFVILNDKEFFLGIE